MAEEDTRRLLSSLKIDRSAAPATGGRPVRWFVLIALLAGTAFGSLLVTFTTGKVETLASPAAATSPARSQTVPPSPAAVVQSPPARSNSVLDATGYVVARRQATVSAKVTGKVVAVYIEEGMRVAANELLAKLDDAVPAAQVALVEAQLAAARAGLAEVDVQLRQAQLDVDRARELAQRNLASQADLDRNELIVQGLAARRATLELEIDVVDSNVRLQRTQLADLEIRAPFAGIVVAKAAQPGEMISPISAGGGFTRTGICTIVDMDSLEVEVDVNEAYINRVRPQQPASVALNAYPDEPLKAAVIAIIPAADRTKATVRVRIGLLEHNDKVLPDMGVRVAFLDPDGAP